MSWYSDVTASNGPNSGKPSDALGPLAADLPHLCEVLDGVKGEDGKWAIPPGSLLIFAEAGKLKFCISPKNWTHVCFGICEMPDRALQSVELALADQACEWKKSSRR